MVMNLAEDYTEFNKSWRTSWSFRAWTVAVPAVSIISIIGGVTGMFYTSYTDLFTVIFAIGTLIAGVLILMAGALYVGFCLRKRW